MDMIGLCESLSNLLKHPLAEAFLYAKWKSLRTAYFLDYVCYYIFLIFFNGLIFCEATVSGYDKSGNDGMCDPGYFIFGYCFTVCGNVYLTLREIIQFWMLKKKLDYFKVDNALDWAVIIPVYIYLISIWIDVDLAFNVGAWVILFGCINLTFHIGGLVPAALPLLHAIFSIAKIVILLIFSSMLPIFYGFMAFFHVTLRDTHDVFDINSGKPIAKIIAMMLGNIEVSEFSVNTGFFILLKCISILSQSSKTNKNIVHFCPMYHIC